ncbi:MAG: DUF1707 SHOCT-like domain-containing protein [Gaiellaceae bacterium]
MDFLVEPVAVVAGDLRVSDDDRERVASEIREHFALGRLDADELSARLGRAYAAETERELEALRADLPRLPPDAAARRVAEAARRALRARRLARRAAVLLLPFCVSTLVWLFAGANGGFWPVWVGLASVLHLSRRSLLHRR